jgi:hypothetical protein
MSMMTSVIRSKAMIILKSKRCFHITIVFVLLLNFSCSTFKPIYRYGHTDTLQASKGKIIEGVKLKLILNDAVSDDLLSEKLSKNLGLKLKQYQDEEGNQLIRIEGKYFYFKTDSLNIYMYKYYQATPGKLYKAYFEIPMNRIAIIERRKFSFGRTMGFVGILFVAFSIYAVSTISWAY